MIDTLKNNYNKGKRSLNELLRSKAYEELKEELKMQGIDINDVDDQEIETIINEQVEKKVNRIKGIGEGAAVATIISLMLGG